MIKLPETVRNTLGTQGQLEARAPNPPLFITGCMRSGTTFLVDKLAGHPQLLKIGSELNEVWSEIGGAPCTGTCEYRGKEHADPQYAYNMSAHFFEFIKESSSLKRKAMRLVTKWNDDVMRVSYDWKNIVPMNKSPHLMNKLEYVHALFPQSKIILIVRDVHAHCASLKRHLEIEHRKRGRRRFIPDDPRGCWSTWNSGGGEPSQPSFPADISVLPKMWLRLNELAIKSLETMPKELYKIISYEHLIKNQEEVLQDLFTHLDLLPKHAKEAKKVASKKIDLINTTSQGDPLKRWEQQLNSKEIGAIDAVIDAERNRYERIMAAATGASD